MMLKKILHEPLIHFLLFGGLIFFYYSYKTPQKTTLPNIKTITLSPYDITALENQFSKEFDTNTTKILQKALIKKYFNDEVLLQEAFSLGLEQQDSSIRNKLLAKMHFILSNITFKEPSQKELKKYYKNHIKDYTKKEKVSFVYLKTDSKKKAEKLRTIVPFLQENSTKLTTVHDISYHKAEEKYGKFFAHALFHLKKGEWSQPLTTPNGIFLAKITNYDKLGDAQDFNDVEYQVYKDYKTEYMNKEKAKKLQKILKRYRLEIQKED